MAVIITAIQVSQDPSFRQVIAGAIAEARNAGVAPRFTKHLKEK